MVGGAQEPQDKRCKAAAVSQGGVAGEPGGPGGANQRRLGCGPALCIRPGEVHHPTPRFKLFSLQRTGVLNRFGVVPFLFSFMGRKANGISG